MRRKEYPSDISREQFERIREILEGARRKTKPRKVDLYEVFCGVLYLLKTGCQWRALPSDFPKWRTVHEYFSLWNAKRKDEGGEEKESILEEILKKISWRGARKTGAEILNDIHYRRRTECEEC